MMDKKTYNRINKEIDRLWKEEKKARYGITKIELVEKTETVGFHEFKGTGIYEYKEVRYPDEKRIEELKKQREALLEITKEERERRAKEAKRKRYIKELAELKDRQAYIEKWLEEN